MKLVSWVKQHVEEFFWWSEITQLSYEVFVLDKTSYDEFTAEKPQTLQLWEFPIHVCEYSTAGRDQNKRSDWPQVTWLTVLKAHVQNLPEWYNTYARNSFILSKCVLVNATICAVHL